jgi:two-component system sensor histidine kinase UhpB
LAAAVEVPGETAAGGTRLARGGATRRRGRRPGPPSLWLLAVGLLAIAATAFVGATRLGGDANRREEAEAVFFRLEARAYQQNALEREAVHAGVSLDAELWRRLDGARREIDEALAELAVLLPGDPAAERVDAATRDWLAAAGDELRLLEAGDLAAARRIDEQQVDPRFERLSALLRRAAVDYEAAATAAQRRARAGVLSIAAAATALALLLLWRVERARARQRAVEASSQQERARLVNKVLTVAEQQRTHLAAELHDGPIQRLTRLGLGLERSHLRLQRGRLDDGAELLADARVWLAEEVQALRRIMATLRPPILEERGLVSALREYLRMVEEQAGVRCALAGGLRKRLPADQEVVLYRVAQEALSNVAKHARAGSVRVELFEDDDVVMLVVDDDGVGFDPVLQPQGNLVHFGLASMHERLELAGGTWEVRSRPGAGTTLIATLPRELVLA